MQFMSGISVHKVGEVLYAVDILMVCYSDMRIDNDDSDIIARLVCLLFIYKTLEISKRQPNETRLMTWMLEYPG